MQQTHYDTLKVSRDAPIEVIRAAYRALSQKYHPDRNPTDSAAADFMGLLNNAYEILSDPDRRHAHDAWIRDVEAEALHARQPEVAAPRSERNELERQLRSDSARVGRFVPHLRQYGLLYGGALLAMSVAAVIAVVPRPQQNPWLVAKPTTEDREATIRRMASEVMLRPSEGVKSAAPVPPVVAPEPGAVPLDDPLFSSAEHAVPASSGTSHPSDDAHRPNHTARAITHPRESAPAAAADPTVILPAEDPPIVRPAPPNHIKAAGKPLPDGNAVGK